MPRTQGRTTRSQDRTKFSRRKPIVEQLGPINTIWTLGVLLPKADRAELLEACDRIGVKRTTATPQVQLLLYARRHFRLAKKLPQPVKQTIKKVALMES